MSFKDNYMEFKDLALKNCDDVKDLQINVEYKLNT